MVSPRDAENLQDIYRWRLQQEKALRIERGTGMTDEEVMSFVDGCKFVKATF